MTELEIILYDLACTKNVCFSPAVWRIRFMLNYKEIPYKTIFLEFPDIKPELKKLHFQLREQTSLLTRDEMLSGLVALSDQYTVPAITHIPTNTSLMDSLPIAQFLESTYPSPSVLLTSQLGGAIETKAGAVFSTLFGTSIVPREGSVLVPRSAAYFRRTREAALGHALEDLLLPPGKEEEVWTELDAELRAVGEMMVVGTEGRFILGETPSMADFFVVGMLQAARVVDEGVWESVVRVPGFGAVYEACEVWMERKD